MSQGGADRHQPPRPVNLALQGGGAHGAFTWGVLERLLDEPALSIEAISGTSAGAMNAAVFTSGWVENGADGARALLEAFWDRVARLDLFNPIQRNFWDRVTEGYNVDSSPGLAFVETLTRTFSPYQVNPFDFNPLRDILEELIDFDHLRAPEAPRLFVSATNVNTGRARIFRNEEITVDALLASACLPQLFQAVEVEGEYYWDGGFMGNPALWPMIYACEARDMVIVQINPLERPGVPRTAQAINDRMTEISFNASLMHEMRAIEFVNRLVRAGALDETNYKALRIHLIADQDTLNAFGSASKLNADWGFLTALRETGSGAADRWLAASLSKVGKESSVDLRETYL